MMVTKTMVEAFGRFAIRWTQQEVRRQEFGAMLLRYLERYWLALVPESLLDKSLEPMPCLNAQLWQGVVLHEEGRRREYVCTS
jgi:hypothetical protein